MLNEITHCCLNQPQLSPHTESLCRGLGSSPGGRGEPTPQSLKVTCLHAQLALDPQPLPLHDVPELAQIGLGDDVVGLEPQRS